MFTFAKGQEKNLTSIRIVSKRLVCSNHTENLRWEVCLHPTPSLVVEDFRMSQPGGFLRQNSMPSLGKKSLAMTLCFDPESSENCRLQSCDQGPL